MIGAGGHEGGTVVWTLGEGGRLQPSSPQNPPGQHGEGDLPPQTHESHCLLLRPRAVRFALRRQVSPDLGSGTLASLPPAAHCWPASVSVIQGMWLPPEVGLGAIRHATGQNVTLHEAAQPRPRARGQTEPPGLSEAKS